MLSLSFHPTLSCVLLACASASSAKTFDVTSFGAIGDGSTDSTKAVQDTFDAIKAAGTSGTVLFPKGSYVFGPVHFEKLNNVVITFADGAKMSSLTDAKKWAKLDDDSGYIPWIQGSSCSGLEIHGGVFEGHNSFWDFLHNKEKKHNPRPYMMKFSDVTDFKAHDMTLKNSPHTHFKIAGGTNVEIWKMHLETKMATANTDGIMLADVQTGHVHDVWIQNGDDCLKANDDSKNVVFEDGTCIGGHGLSIGGDGGSLGIQDIVFRNFNLQDMSYGARIKFTKKTSGFVNNVTYQNLTMKHVKHPLYITTGYQSTQATLSSTTRSTRLKLEDINYIDITATDDKAIGGSGGSIASPGDFECDSTAPCKDLHLRKVTMTTKKKWIGKSAGGDESSVLPDASSLFKPSLARSSSSMAFV